MVKVLSKIEHQVKCPQCGSDLSYTYEDVQYNRALVQHYIRCPVCNNEEIHVPDPDLREYEG